MITLSEYANLTKKITAAVEGGSIVLSVRLGGLCRGEREKYLSRTDSDRGLKEYLCSIIAEWDITENGQVLPITPDTMDRLPDCLIGSIIDAITEQTGPGESRGSGTTC